MRPIDGKELADEILGEIYERGQASGIWEKQLEIGAITYRDIEFADGYDRALDDVYRKIKAMPTVEAIPIEWIKNYASHKASKDLIDCYWHFWEDDIYEMIEEWKKAEEWKKENADN